MYMLVYGIIAMIMIIILIGWSLIQKFLFYPDKTVKDKLSPNELLLNDNKNNIISAIFEDKGNNTPIILFSHGNAGNIFRRKYMFKLFLNKNVSLFMYDYSGFGRSTGYTSTKNIIKNGEFVFEYLKNKYPNRKIILWGESMGSAVSWHLASKYKCSGLIITSGYSSLADVIDDVVLPGLGKLLSFITYLPDNKLCAKKISCPVLMFHSINDELIPYKQCLKIKHILDSNFNYTQNKNINSLIKTTGGHNFYIGGYINKINDFVFDVAKL